ncbi:VOC family protein [Lapillicoccus jejuensis]|uniref:Catechol 2,3-dioxygenase-like lactoylglutathione lyase family enzyme n=1 Tax=Lapillicoccus jejuensis TaxID=402171 RepID=A0A542DVA5_9MICO|nr:VOC family protein [Lapillicoccus jejuensis]TQJ06976.1 catechol 2,3-dioxygenase-like lactoylglutathione lyase family enzyme [Lapillicoccus jejuensis]
MDIASVPIRLARPTRDLEAARRFWVEGLGLDVLWESGADAEGGHALLMVGASGARWHLELVHDPDAHAASRPSPEDLLVLYLGVEIEPEVVERLVTCGGTRVASPNPYWQRWGVTVEDPDGYRLVLSHRSWE